MHIEMFEYCLVEFTASVVIGLLVVRASRAEQLETVLQMFGDAILIQLVGVESPLGLGSCCCDAGLLAPQLGSVDCVGIERVKDLLTVAIELSQAFCGLLPGNGDIREDSPHMFEDDRPDAVDMARAQCHRSPVIGDRVFEMVGLNRSEGASIL